MAIKINNTTVIDDSRNLVVNSVSFQSGGTQSSPSSGGSSSSVVANLKFSFSYVLENPNAYSTGTNDRFSNQAGPYSISVFNDKILVGTTGEDSAAGTDTGAAYLFDAKTGQLLFTFLNPVGSNDLYGFSVALSQNYAVVSAHNADTEGTNSGRVYVYDVRTGALLHTITNPTLYGTNTNDLFGFRVAIYGDTLAISATNEDETSNAESGRVYLFSASSGKLKRSITNPSAVSTGANDLFGRGLAINEKYLIIGTERELGSSLETFSGVVYVYGVGTGDLLHTFTNPNTYSTFAGDNFGDVVDLQGDYLVVGARGEDLGGFNAGVVYVFDLNAGALYHTIQNPGGSGAKEYDQFGQAVAIEDDKIFVGSFSGESGGQVVYGGTVYIFDLHSANLLETISDRNSFSTAPQDGFGDVVRARGNYLVIGASGEDPASGSNSGVIYVYSIKDSYIINNVSEINLTNGVSLKESDRVFQNAHSSGEIIYTLTNPNLYSTAGLDFFGGYTAMSEKYIIASASDEDSSQGTNSGVVYIFDVFTGSLVYTLTNPNAFSTAAEDYFGSSLAISNKYAVVGTYFEDDAGGASSGAVYVYELTSGSLLYTLNNPNTYSTSANDEFGRTIKIFGDYLFVGAPGEDSSNNRGGKIYVFNIISGSLLSTINHPGSSSVSSSFGKYFDVFGSTLVAGNPDDLNFSPSQWGFVYVINFLSNTLLFTISNPNSYSTQDSDAFGESVAVSEKYIAVGARGEDSINGTGTGIVYIFNRKDGSLFSTIINPQPDQDVNFVPVDDAFGNKVALSGNYCIVTSSELPDGLVFIFNIITGQLLNTIKLGVFPSSISAYGNLLTVGQSNFGETGQAQSGRVSVISISDVSKIDKLLTLV